MKSARNAIFILLIICGTLYPQQPPIEFLKLQGPYLGQKPPGATPEPFVPGIVSTGMFTRDIAITPDSSELYFGVVIGSYTYSTIVMTKMINGRWTEPEVPAFANDPVYKSIEPCITPDGKKFFFSSDRPVEGKPYSSSDYDIYVMERTSDGWGEPKNIGSRVNSSEGEYFPSVTNDGTLYFTRTFKAGANEIFRSRLEKGVYSEPEKLPVQVNSGKGQFNAFIDPDERYLIVPVFGRPDSKGSTDYYVTFRNQDDTWNEPVNMGDQINTKKGDEYSPYVSRDGKYFFFMSSRVKPDAFRPGERLSYKKLNDLYHQYGNGHPSIYWMDASIIQNLKPQRQ